MQKKPGKKEHRIVVFARAVLLWPIPAFLCAIWLVLARYNRNVDQLAFEYAWPILLSSLVLVAIVTAILAWRKASTKSYLVLGWVTFIFFIYGDLHSAFGFAATQNRYLSVLGKNFFTLIFILFCSYLIIKRLYKPKTQTNKVYKIVNSILIILVAFNIASPLKRIFESDTRPPMNSELSSQPINPQAAERDVYYLVFDRYASDETLQKLYGYDNSEFSEYLTRKGFFINRDAHSNYQFTTQSVSSTLNLRYFEEENRLYKDTDKNLQPYYDLLNFNSVGKFVKQFGYKYFHLGSWWEPTKHSDEATRNYARASYLTFFNWRIYPNEFTQLVFQNSLLKPLFDHPIKIGDFALVEMVIDITKVHANSFEYQLRSINEVIDRPEKKYIFGHFLMPHPPFVYKANGEKYADEKITEVDKKAYIEQLRYTNTQIKDLIDKILAKPGPKPVIILQADEGPYPGDYYKNRDDYDWNTAPPDVLQEKFGIQSAYYFPEPTKQPAYQGMSGVNSFRLVFNNYFGSELELLPDKSYIYERENRYYNYIDVTGRWPQ